MADVNADAGKEALAERSYESIEGVPELVTMGAQRMAEGVRLQLRNSDVARDVAKIVFDAWLRMTNRGGNPDLMGDSDDAKKVMSDVLRNAGEGFERTFENVEALRRLYRSVQYYRTDVRAKYLRSLDDDADARKLFANVLKGKPRSVPASRWVADQYGTDLLGDSEKKALRYQEQQEAAGREIQAIERGKRIADGIAQAQGRIAREAQRAAKLDKDSDARRLVKTQIDEAIDALRQMRASL